MRGPVRWLFPGFQGSDGLLCKLRLEGSDEDHTALEYS